jgi:predicted transcriptional regulator
MRQFASGGRVILTSYDCIAEKGKEYGMQIIKIGIMPLAEFRTQMIAVARGERKVGPDEPKVWFESLQALANALKTDLATLERVLLPADSDDHDETTQ